MPAPSLRELQQAFWRSVTGAAGGAEPARLLEVVAPSATLTPAERVGIYGEMYGARLVDVLREDFAGVAVVVGADRFDALARAYCAQHPSEHPSVRHLGRAFADFLAAHAPDDAPPALADLARLEWTRLAVFDAPDPAPIGLADLLAVAPDDWPALRFEPIAALQVVVSDWPVHLLWEQPEQPVGAPVHTALRVWRRELMVCHAPMDPTEEVSLGRLIAGDTFGALCEGFADAETAAAQLLRWIEDRLLARFR